MSETPVTVLDAFVQNFDDSIKAAISAGDLVLENSVVSAKASDTDKVGQMTYQKIVAKTMNGILVLASGSQEKLLEMVSAQFDAPVRANVRNAILREIEGPDKVIRQIAGKLAKKTGKNEDEVFAQLKANPALLALLTD